MPKFDSHAYTRWQFLRAVGHTVGSEKMLSESQSDADDGDDDENTEAQADQPQQQNDDHTTDDAGTPSTESAEVAVVFCEVSRATA